MALVQCSSNTTHIFPFYQDLCFVRIYSSVMQSLVLIRFEWGFDRLWGMGALQTYEYFHMVCSILLYFDCAPIHHCIFLQYKGKDTWHIKLMVRYHFRFCACDRHILMIMSFLDGNCMVRTRWYSSPTCGF